jgi:RNA polymerase primary sigma factor
LSTLNKRESKIIKMYFGLESGQEMNLREIGEELNLTNERVRQIKDFALKKLRTYGKSMKLREFLNCELR